MSKLSEDLKREIEENGPLPLEKAAEKFFFSKLSPSWRRIISGFIKDDPFLEIRGGEIALRKGPATDLGSMDIRSCGFAFIDTETTMNPGMPQRMIEIGIVAADGAEEAGNYATLLDPGVPVTKDVFDLTGISQADVKGAPCFERKWAEIGRALEDRVIVAHNLSFDMMILDHELERADISFPFRLPSACTLRLARALFREEKRLMKKELSCSLDALCDRFGLTSETRHRALADAYLCFRLFFRLIEYAEKEKGIEIRTLQDLKDLGALK